MWRSITALVVCLVPGIAAADLFGGPSNYDACVAERMKGLERIMFNTVSKSCEREFEVKLAPRDKKLVDVDWVNTTETSVEVNIQKNDSDFLITMVVLAFSKKPCEDSEGGDYEIIREVDFKHWMPGRDAKTDATIKFVDTSTVSCFITKEVYGKRYK
jgi:hypothetical protein